MSGLAAYLLVVSDDWIAVLVQRQRVVPADIAVCVWRGDGVAGSGDLAGVGPEERGRDDRYENAQL